MVNIQVTKGEQYRIELDGHAGDEKGKDIVCSAISALVQNILVGLEKFDDLDWEYKLEDGSVAICIEDSWHEDIDKAIFLIETTISSLKEIEKHYPEKMKVIERNNNDII